MAGQKPTEEEFDELESILNTAKDAPVNRLSEWERGFIEDTFNRYEKYGKNILLSEKQWAVLRKIYDACTE